ncbi:Centrosomal protein of 295 kDa [Camelus dromedarius]|uniref:Centrosomal protein of 295 kDa n=1 Tax=Camelus dromedarius TaxID=9838 RepID=A0A5N4DLN7_CAMDR|nr:Centrosomal protein of 295 kDa [Camelus dromedarius]
MLKEKYPSMSATPLVSDSVASVPPQESEQPAVISEHQDQGQRPKLSPDKHQPVQPMQISNSEQDSQVPRQKCFPQRQVETTGTLITSDVLAKQALEPQEQLKQLSQSETQQRDYTLVPKDSHTLSRALSHEKPLTLQEARERAETSRATAFPTSDSQQVSEDSGSVSSKLIEPSSFLPLVPERSFSCLPTKVESGDIQEPFSAMSKSIASVNHYVVGQMQEKFLPSSETITAQQDNLKALQEQLDLQKEVLRSRQAAQEQLLLCKQKELEGQTGLSVFLPLVPLDSFASLPFAKAESGRNQESSPTKNETAGSSGHPGVLQVPDRLLSFSQPILSQQDNFKFLQEQLSIQRDSLQARREAQEVLCVHKQGELDGRVWAQQSESPSLPSQVAQRTFISMPSAGTQSQKIQKQYSPKSEKGLLSSQSEIPKSHDGSSSFLQQFLPLHDSLKLLQEQLTTQRDALQARYGAQAELLLRRQRNLGASKSVQMSSSFPPTVAHRSVASQASKTGPGRIQNFYFSEESVTPSSYLVMPTFQDASLRFPQCSLPQQQNLTPLQGQSHIQRVTLGAKPETQEIVHKQNELEKKTSSEQTATSLSLSQGAESERFQEFKSFKSDSPVPLSHSKIPRFQERLLGLSQHVQTLRDDLEGHQRRLDPEEEALHLNQETQGNVSSEQAGLSFIPQLGQLSLTSLPSAESLTTQEPLSVESDGGHFQIPQLQDRLLKITQLIHPQQDNLRALQEQLATQREAIIQSRQEARGESLLREQSEWKGRASPEQAGTLSFLVQHPFSPLPLRESGRIREPCSTKSDNVVSGHSEVPRSPGRLAGLPEPVSPKQDYPITFSQEHLYSQTNSLPSIENTQKEMVLPRQYKFEDKSSEHFIQPHHGDLKARQQQSDTQNEVQEELLLQRVSELEKGVSSEQTSTPSSLSQTALPVADSERTRKASPIRSGSTVPSSHPGIPGSQDRLLSFSQAVLSQQDHVSAQLGAQREVLRFTEKAQEELPLNRQTKPIESESSEHAVPSLFLPMEREHSFIPLPFAEVKSKDINELYSAKNERAAPSSVSVSPRLQDRFLSFSQPVLAQQDNLGLQKQLDLQREVLHYSQKAQKELLVQRQAALQKQIQKHQETLKDFFKNSQTSKPTVENNFETQKLKEWLPHLQDLAKDDQENISPADRSSWDENQLLSEDSKAKQSGEHLDKEVGRRPSKPPVAKVKCGLDLTPHELSAIQEVESPASGRTSMLGKSEFYQDRDPLRVSISREQSFLGSPLDRDPRGHLHPVAQENIRDADSAEAVKVEEAVAENHAVLSHAVEKEEHPYLGPSVKPDEKAETQEVYREPLSSITVSTGSILSYENTDLSLTDRALRRTSLHSSLSTSLNQQPGPNVAHAAAQSFAAEDTEGSEQSFQELLPEFSSQEGSQHADLPSIFSIEARDSFQGVESQNYSEQNEESQNKQKSVHFQLSVGNLQSSVFNSSGEAHVFHQLNLQHSTPCGSASSECSIKDQLEGRKDRLGFEELSERGVDTVLQGQGFTEDDKNKTCGVVNINPQVEEIDSQLCATTVEIGTSIQTPYSLTVPNERCPENSTKAEAPRITGNLSQLAQSELFVSSGSFSLQSSIPVWVSEFLPLVSETENSDYPAVSEHPVEKPAVSAGSFQLKGVNKVRVSLPEDRKTAQAHMHQRAQRLYRQLAEVKQQKEEKAKQEAYAQNRARAKEFHKRTLEKLRAKNTH